MRFDDTNPVKEDQEFVDGILDTVRWLGFDWEHGGESNLYHASDYFEDMYRFAEHLIETGYAYVDEQSADETRETRGTLTERGTDSPYRDRPIEESLRLFREMRAGQHAEGSMILRAKIDMGSPNINMRDPAIYRIRFAEHHMTGDAWKVYPMYAYAHPIEDALENITHSICTLEFEDQRPFYDWVLERIVPLLRKPQYEAAQGQARRDPRGRRRSQARVRAALPKRGRGKTRQARRQPLRAPRRSDVRELEQEPGPRRAGRRRVLQAAAPSTPSASRRCCSTRWMTLRPAASPTPSCCRTSTSSTGSTSPTW